MARFTTEKLDQQLLAAIGEADYTPTDPSKPIGERLADVRPGKSDQCKTATLLWEDEFRRSRFLQNCAAALVAGTVVVLIVTLGLAVIRTNLVAGITGAVGAVVTGGGAIFVRSERDKSIKLLQQYTRDRKTACKSA